jgi:hypothetical protein
MSTWPSDEALWTSVEKTLAAVVLPAITDVFARSSVLQLVSIARYAATRGRDPTSDRAASLAQLLDELGVTRLGDDAVSVYRDASAALVSLNGSADSKTQMGKTKIRLMLVEHLDADLATNSVLMNGFRGVLPDG